MGTWCGFLHDDESSKFVRRRRYIARLGGWSPLTVGVAVALLGAFVLILAGRFAVPGGSETPASQPHLAGYGALPLRFETNLGQSDGQVDFLTRGNGYAVFLTSGEAVLSLRKPPAVSARSLPEAATAGTVLRMQLVGAHPRPKAAGLEPLPGKTNYLIGNDPSRWRTDVPTFGKVRYSDVYPGVDLVYYGKQRQLEWDFIVAPGADPGVIALAFDGADELEIDSQGNLLVSLPGGQVQLHRPIVYQEMNGVRREVMGGFRLNDARQVGLRFGPYDPSLPLVIDPILVYSTYLGGSSSDVPNAIAVDSTGSAYIAGYTLSSNFPTASPRQALHAGGAYDGFVAKLNSAGSALVYSTYLGGNGYDDVTALAVDSSGNVYLTGKTNSTNFPVLGAFQAAFRGGAFDAFVAKLNATGSGLVYSTYLGGNGFDDAARIAVDGSGSAHVVGFTASADFPTAPAASPLQGAHAGGTYDAFVTKLSPAGSTLAYSTYLGGSGDDTGGGIAIDSSGSAYVVGHTDSTNFPTASPYQVSHAGGTNDLFVAKLNPAGSALVYSTYLGGDGSDTGGSIAVDAAGNAYVAASTNSTNFPAVTPYQVALAGATDGVVAKLNAAGSALVYSTYLGGGGDDSVSGMAVDSAGNVYVAGTTASTNFPILNAVQSLFGGVPNDGFVTKLNPAGSALVYSTYLGGSGDDVGQGIAVDGTGDAYVVGGTASVNFPTASPLQAAFGGGGSDAFVAKLSETVPSTSTPVPPTGTPLPPTSTPVPPTDTPTPTPTGTSTPTNTPAPSPTPTATPLPVTVVEGAWTQSSPPAGPTARYALPGAYDAAGQRLVLFGGRDGSPSAETWVLAPFGAATWTQLTPAGTPSARSGHSAVFDGAGQRLIVFGGQAADGSYLSDVWALSLSGALQGAPSWSQLSLTAGPSGRSNASAVYDPVNQRMLVFGGRNATERFGDVWALSLGAAPAWTQALPAGTAPSARDGHAAVYDMANQQLVVFGGDSGAGLLNDAWALSLTGTPTWSRLVVAGVPPSARSGQAGVYDPTGGTTGRMLVFGGSTGSPVDEVWALNLSAFPSWFRLIPAGVAPAARSQHAAIFDSAGRRLVAFGGAGASGALSDVWILAFATAPTPTNTPANAATATVFALTPTATPTATPAPTDTATPTPTPTSMPTSTPANASTATVLALTPTATATQTPTSTPTATNTPANAATATALASTPSATPTPTPAPTETSTPANAATATALALTPTATRTPMLTPTVTPTPAPSPAIRGKLVAADGSTVTDEYSVELFRSDHLVVVQADLQAGGTFTIHSVPATGTYFLTARPPAGSALQPSSPQKLTLTVNPDGSLAGGPKDVGTVTLRPAVKVVRGVVTAESINDLGETQVIAFPAVGGGPGDEFFQTRVITATRTFTIGLKPGVWALNIRPDPIKNPAALWVYNQPPQVVSFDTASGPETKSVTFVVTGARIPVYASVRLPDGTTPSNDVVSIQLTNEAGLSRRDVVRNGFFLTTVPSGTYRADVFSVDPRWGPPSNAIPRFSLPVRTTQSDGGPAQIAASPYVPYGLGTITLTLRSSAVLGTVRDGSGQGVPNVFVSAWNTTSKERSFGLTGTDGTYALTVSRGTYDVAASPPAESRYTVHGKLQHVKIGAGEQKKGVDFWLSSADARVTVRVVDASGQVLSGANGFAFARKQGRFVPGASTDDGGFGAGEVLGPGAPVVNGIATLNVPQASGVVIGVGFAPGSDYPSGESTPLSVSSGADITIDVPVGRFDATISGSLRSNGAALTGVMAQVQALGVRGGVLVDVDPTTGRYSLKLQGGRKWPIGIVIDPQSGYQWQPTGFPEVDLTSASSATYDFELVRADATARGTVRDPFGRPLPGALVRVSRLRNGRTPGNLVATAVTDPNGEYQFQLQRGQSYSISAETARDRHYVGPGRETCDVAVGPTCTVNLQFRVTDATLSGKVLLGGAPVTGTALVRAWSDSGGSIHGWTDDSGSYRLDIASGGRWHVEAFADLGGKYAAAPEQVVSTTSGPGLTAQASIYTVDLRLDPAVDLPGSTSVSYDATMMRILHLANDVKVVIPAGALATAGQVTVRAAPNALLPTERTAHPIDIGYSFEATNSDGVPITKFNQHVMIEVPYEPSSLPAGTSELDLAPAYYDASLDVWRGVNSSMVDRDNRKVILLTDHFTDFTIVTPEPPSFAQYLPVVFAAVIAN